MHVDGACMRMRHIYNTGPWGRRFRVSHEYTSGSAVCKFCRGLCIRNPERGIFGERAQRANFVPLAALWPRTVATVACGHSVAALVDFFGIAAMASSCVGVGMSAG